MSLIEEIVARYGSGRGEPIEVRLSGGEVLRFRRVRSYGEVRELRERAGDFVLGARRRMESGAGWSEFSELDDGSLAAAGALAALCLDGAGEEGFLRLALEAGGVFAEVIRQVDAGSGL